MRRGCSFVVEKGHGMTILKMKAWGDFDVPYEVNVGAGDNGRIRWICRILNEFCEQLPGCDKDIKLSVYLSELEYSNILVNRLVDAGQFTAEQAKGFVEKLENICADHWSYVYADMFTYEDVEAI